MLDNSRMRAILLLVGVFVAGGVVGAAIARAFPSRPPLELRRRTVSTTPENERIPTPLEDLGLTENEKTHLRAIAKRWRPRASESIEEVRQRVADLENGMFAEMLCELPQDKRDRYLAQLQANDMDQTIIDKRFALVRANRCGEVSGEP
jgi:hypothetical protein